MKYHKISEYKKKKIAGLARGGASISDLSDEYHVPRSSIYHWMARYNSNRKQPKLISIKDYNDLKSHDLKIEHQFEILQTFVDGLPVSMQEKYKYMDTLCGKYAIREICDAMRVDRGTYYNHLRSSDQQAAREARRAFLMDAIYESWLSSNRTYGAGKVWIDLNKNRNIHVGEKLVRELMREMQIGKTRPSKKGTFFYAWNNRRSNLLLEGLRVTGINQLWVTDMLDFEFHGRKIFFSAYLDAYSRKILSMKMGPRKSTNLSAACFREAVKLRQPDKSQLILHSDNGGENRSFTMLRLTKQYCKEHSWSRKHTPTDNPIMECFFKYFRDEVLYHGDFFSSEAEIKREMQKYIEHYNYERIHTSLKGCTPAEYEKKYPSVSKVFVAKENSVTNDRYLPEPEDMEYVDVDNEDAQGVED